ncbi:DUF2306 domain-containing protein [Mangrovivirga sp. M17]|uniref:DUF2306 domain-containing protein n=1 Tax=Mangrovivirga halotolerans TaxID=2993936 RepID=A0ABT3RME3_9BACT|nr:DUF2306 domain-containing protein [Mangrovivirga halotolerans]MCX2742982.1 DUF2306 domain-containing protein [Mangrovivirga halotolerans]
MMGSFSNLGWIHLTFAVLALITGTLILILKKATTIHKRIGYVYVFSMVGVNLTSFFIYRLFGGFGIFHFAAIISGATITLGMIPFMYNKPNLYIHFSFMYWSVIGLYAAFASEILTRIPETPFFWIVGLATGVIFLLGGINFRFKKKIWAKRFVSSERYV